MLNINELCPFNEHNRQPFGELYNEFFRPVYYFSRSLLHDKEAAHGVTQETFIELWNSSQVFETKQNIKNFLHRVARNRCYDVLRKRRLQKLYHLMHGQDAETAQDAQAWEEAETFSILYKALQMLPPRQRRVTILSFWYGKTNEEIAIILKISERTVRRAKLLALQTLKQLLLNHLTTITIVLLLAGPCTTLLFKKTGKILSVFGEFYVFLVDQ